MNFGFCSSIGIGGGQGVGRPMAMPLPRVMVKFSICFVCASLVS